MSPGSRSGLRRLFPGMKRPKVIGLVLLGACAFVLLGFLIRYDGTKKRPVTTAQRAHADHSSTASRLTKSEEDRLLLGDIAAVPFQELYGLLSKRTPEEIAKLAEQLQTLPRSRASEAKVAAFFKTWAAFDAKAALASAIALRDARFRSDGDRGCPPKCGCDRRKCPSPFDQRSSARCSVAFRQD